MLTVRAILHLLPFLTVSCVPLSNSPSVREPPYSWGVRNSSSRDLDDTILSYQQDKQTVYANYAGWVGSGGAKASDGGKDPIPQIVHLHWVDVRDHSVHETDTPVHGHIPDERHFTGVLWIVIDDNGVALQPKRWNP